MSESARERLEGLIDAVASWSPVRARMIRELLAEQDAAETERVRAWVEAALRGSAKLVEERACEYRDAAKSGR